jgi:hypothetical protein
MAGETMRAALCVLVLALSGLGCDPPVVPAEPTWADVAPIVRGNCVGCHGWTASDRPPDAAGVHPPNTGGSLRLDFFNVTQAACGDAARAIAPTVLLAGSGVAPEIATDLVVQPGAQLPRMPPQPYPAMQGWEIETIERWTANPVKGPPPPSNRPPTIATSQLPSTVDGQFSFTAVLDDPDGDSVIGVIEAPGFEFQMDHPGAFGVSMDSSSWPPGVVYPVATLCDGWTSTTVDLGPILVQH